MSNPTIYIAITDHGFGHAARTASIAGHLQQLLPSIKLIVVTTAPRWLLECYIDGDFIYRQRSFDVGVVQADSLKMDLDATLVRWQNILSKKDEIIAQEVAFCQEHGVDLVFGDAPPLTTLIAKQLGVPCWMSGNFGWDFIYQDWGDRFKSISDWISECYGLCDRLFRVPLHESMERFPIIEDVGLTGGDPKYPLEELRDKFNLIQPKNGTILLTFGGLSLDAIPYQNVSQFPELQFITLDRTAPDLPNLIKVLDRAYRPVDFMPLCDRVVSKPGYSTYAEALKLDIPIVSLTRAGFAEAEVILNGMQDYGYHQVISPDQFFNTNWDFLNQSLQPPRINLKLATDGNDFIARSIVNYLGGQSV
ncbi:glycosyl transferase [Chamaesiphon sp. VAR_48_metabat_135_sub]|uniref:glycosyl transferase n=1 Tax=Chamaesiphon sp. VAR_48_metabat_135_sub TaxID=2964699 RepID=UPI00286A2D4E|nr:glycosyl transferase [Chamaesiphon sp. VAR_48_metabat_135_sub]